MKESTFQYIVVFFFLYLIGELYWRNGGENYEAGRILNLALVFVLGCNLVYHEWIAHKMRKQEKIDKENERLDAIHEKRMLCGETDGREDDEE